MAAAAAPVPDHRSSNRRIHRWAMAALVGLCVATAGCDSIGRGTSRLFDGRTPRERYVDGLAAAGLSGSALARDWAEAAERALRDAGTVVETHREVGYLDPAAPAALAFRIRVARGQEITFAMDLAGDTTAQVFLDAWLVADSAGRLDPVAAADSGARTLVFEPRRAGEYVLRAQSELLRGGRFTITLRLTPTLAFPVMRGRNTDIGSRFGASRDGGVRSHQGIDIFARRGTPALATGDAFVSRVDTGSLGGLVVWLRDTRGNRLYYAHLDTQLVREGQHLVAGDTVGLVGNTGNARTTPPHLHFGVYRRGEGPLDPYGFVQRLYGTNPRLAVDTTLLGRWARTRPAPVRVAPDEGAAARDTLARDAAVRVVAAVGRWYHVQLPDGRTGYLPASRVRSAQAGMGRLAADRPVSVGRRPGGAGPANEIARLAAGDTVTVLGRFAGQLLVRTARGVAGWMAAPPAARPVAD